MYRRILSLVLTVGLILTLCACAKEPEAASVRPVEVPEYVEREAMETARKVSGHRSENAFSFAWLSDLHVGYSYEALDWKTDESSVMEAGQALDVLSGETGLELIVLGGDLANGGPNSTREQTLQELEDAAEYMRPATFFTPTLYLVGNHDDAPYRETGERLTPEELYAGFGRKSALAGAVTNESHGNSNYGYLDFPLQQMRVIYLDTNDKTGWPSTGWVEGDSGSAYMDACNVSASQLEWLAGTALDFSAKEKPDAWGFVVMSHVPFDIVSGVKTYTDAATGERFEHNTDFVIDILTAYLQSESGSVTLNGETARFDFTGLEEKARLYACVHGHRHNFEYRAYGPLEIPAILCPNVRDGRERESGDGKTYLKTPGTGESTSFNIITIDRETDKLFADCYGAGVDRVWTLQNLDQSQYINLVERAVDPATGELLDGCGYRNGVRLSSLSNLPEEAGYVTTGVMRWRKTTGDFADLKPIYIRGVTLDTEKTYVRIALLTQDEEGDFGLQALIKGGEGADWNQYFEIDRLADQYYRLTPLEGAMSSWKNIRHFMLCVEGTGENLAVSVGKPIK